MSEPSAYIRDHQSLIELNNTLEYCADSILKILEQVDSYLKGVVEAMKHQIEMLEEELRVAEEKLSNAEQALSDCEASQEWNEEKGEYRPSCSLQEGRVRLARNIRDKYQERLNRAQDILRACEYEIDEYKKWPCIIIPPGGEKLLEALAQEHTDRATAKMREILEVVERYLRYNMSTQCFNSSLPSSTVPDEGEYSDNRALSPDQKKERFDNAIQQIIERQQEENSGVKIIADANRVIRCPRCGRPPIACICSNTREKEYTREAIHIINNDFSR